jgi:hypothetical protein
MISPMTPPGTEVVCINWPKAPVISRHIPLQIGAIYTVRRIVENHLLPGVFGVWLEEILNEKHWTGIELAYGLKYFRPLDLGGLDAFLDVREKEPA